MHMVSFEKAKSIFRSCYGWRYDIGGQEGQVEDETWMLFGHKFALGELQKGPSS